MSRSVSIHHMQPKGQDLDKPAWIVPVHRAESPEARPSPISGGLEIVGEEEPDPVA